MTPTSRWLAAVGAAMPPLEGPEGTAERILLLLHYGIDWQDGWVGNYRKTYWTGILPDRVVGATYLTESLRRWWRDVSDELCSAPRSAAQRVELETLLRAEPVPVLEVLRYECEPLLLRTRITTDEVRAVRAVDMAEAA